MNTVSFRRLPGHVLTTLTSRRQYYPIGELLGTNTKSYVDVSCALNTKSVIRDRGGDRNLLHLDTCMMFDSF